MIKKILKHTITASVILLGFNASAQLFDFSSDLQGWDASFTGAGGASLGTVSHAASEGVNSDGALMIVREGDNANFGYRSSATNTVTLDATANKYIRIVFKNNTKANLLRVSGANGDGDTIKDDSNGFVFFPIAPDTDEFVTMYLDMSNIKLWKGDLQNFILLPRQNFVNEEVGQSFLLDEIEFLSVAPTDEFSEFIQNPNFEDTTTVSEQYTGANTPFATRIITSQFAQDGSQSLRINFSSDAENTYWSFARHIEDYSPSSFPANTEIQVKMWVRTNRAAPIRIAARVDLKLNGTNVAQPLQSVTTTNTVQDWEELTFTLTAPGEFNQASLWFALEKTDPATDLLEGDNVYIDNLSATITDPAVLSLPSLGANKIEGASVSAANGNITVTGANLDEVYDMTGKKVGSIGLSNGIYIVKISKGDKQQIIKVAM